VAVFILCKISGRQFRKITTNSTKSKNYSETVVLLCCVKRIACIVIAKLLQKQVLHEYVKIIAQCTYVTKQNVNLLT